MEYTHGTKLVFIKPVDTCFTGELQLNQINTYLIWFSSVGGLRKNSMMEELRDQPLFSCYFNIFYTFCTTTSTPFYLYCYC